MRFCYMNEKDRQTVENIIRYCDRINSHISYFEKSNETYFENQPLQDACALVIIQIEEYVNRISNEFKEEHPQIPWNEIIGMRNVHTHHYESVIEEIVW